MRPRSRPVPTTPSLRLAVNDGIDFLFLADPADCSPTSTCATVNLAAESVRLDIVHASGLTQCSQSDEPQAFRSVFMLIIQPTLLFRNTIRWYKLTTSTYVYNTHQLLQVRNKIMDSSITQAFVGRFSTFFLQCVATIMAVQTQPPTYVVYRYSSLRRVAPATTRGL